jgi:hypothetical protein
MNLDWVNPAVIGFTLNVVGLFFLASAITLRRPRREMEEVLGVEQPRSLSNVNDHLANQVQTYTGFVFLVAGHVLLMGNELRASAGDPLDKQNPGLVAIAFVLVAVTVGTMVLLKLVQSMFARRHFRRLLAEVLRESGYSLERNQRVAVEIGELLQIPKGRDQSVPEYIGEVRRALGLERAEPVPRPKPRRAMRPADS